MCFFCCSNRNEEQNVFFKSLIFCLILCSPSSSLPTVKSVGFPWGSCDPGLLRLREKREPGSQLSPQPATGRWLNSGDHCLRVPPLLPLLSSAQHKRLHPQNLLYSYQPQLDPTGGEERGEPAGGAGRGWDGMGRRGGLGYGGVARLKSTQSGGCVQEGQTWIIGGRGEKRVEEMTKPMWIPMECVGFV